MAAPDASFWEGAAYLIAALLGGGAGVIGERRRRGGVAEGSVDDSSCRAPNLEVLVGRLHESQKGAVAEGFRELRQIAREQDRQFTQAMGSVHGLTTQVSELVREIRESRS